MKSKRLFAEKMLPETIENLGKLRSFCSRFGLLKVKFESEILELRVYLLVKDLGQVQVSYSQMAASLE